MRCNYCREYSRRGDFEVREREGEREELNLTSRKFCKLCINVWFIYFYVLWFIYERSMLISARIKLKFRKFRVKLSVYQGAIYFRSGESSFKKKNLLNLVTYSLCALFAHPFHAHFSSHATLICRSPPLTPSIRFFFLPYLKIGSFLVHIPSIQFPNSFERKG